MIAIGLFHESAREHHALRTAHLQAADLATYRGESVALPEPIGGLGAAPRSS